MCVFSSLFLFHLLPGQLSTITASVSFVLRTLASHLQQINNKLQETKRKSIRSASSVTGLPFVLLSTQLYNGNNWTNFPHLLCIIWNCVWEKFPSRKYQVELASFPFDSNLNLAQARVVPLITIVYSWSWLKPTNFRISSGRSLKSKLKFKFRLETKGKKGNDTSVGESGQSKSRTKVRWKVTLLVERKLIRK